MPYVHVGQENSGDIDLHYEDHGSGDPTLLHCDRKSPISDSENKGMGLETAVAFCRIELSLLYSFKLGEVTQCPQFPFDTLALAKTG